MTICDMKQYHEQYVRAAEAVAAESNAMELYEQWQQMVADGAAVADWLSWERDLERNPVLLRFFAVKKMLQSEPGCSNASCSARCHTGQIDVQ